MTKLEFLQTIQQPPQSKPPDPIAAALAKAGIPTDAPHYAGAIRNVEQALERRKPASRRFWEKYLLSLCSHLNRLAKQTGKEPEQQALRDSIQTVQAVLDALEEMERTESEPRERA